MKRALIGVLLFLTIGFMLNFDLHVQQFLPLQKGDTVPDFTVRTTADQEINLSSLVKKGNVVILFYQGFWCTACLKSLSHFKTDLAKVTQKGGHTIAITPTPLSGQPPKKEKRQDDVSIVIDQDLSLMRAFGVLDDQQTEYSRAEKSFGQQNFSFIPATYIIDENLRIKFAHADAEFTINAFVDSLLIHR